MIKSLNPNGIAPPFAKYAHGVVCDGFVAISGQLALGLDGQIPNGSQAQSKLIFSNIDLILSEAGGSKKGILRINAYVTDRIHMDGYMTARDAWLAEITHLPASTLVIVNGFTRPEFVVEIEALAQVKQKVIKD